MTEQQQQIDNDEISLKELIQKIQEWIAYLKTQWKLIIGIAALSGIIGFVYASFQKPNYLATTTFVLEEDKGGGGAKFYKIITVNNRTEEHTADFAKDYLKIKELALRDKQIKEIAKWSEEKIKETYIKISDDYKDCDFANNWLKK